MVKAIIILDKNPEICLDCPACNVDMMGECKCMALNKNARAHYRLSDCQAKELPDYKTIRPDDTLSEIMRCTGWNDCLDAILNKNKEI